MQVAAIHSALHRCHFETHFYYMFYQFWRSGLQKYVCRRRMKKLLLYIIGFMISTLVIMMLITDVTILRSVLFVDTGDVKLHNLSCSDLELDEPISDNNIFFIETSGIVKEDLVLNARQACAVESAAKMNPNMNVYLLLVSRSMEVNQARKFFDQLESYPNVRIRRVYLDQYMRDTPLEKWYKGVAWNKGYWPLSRMSDALRYLTLWKYAGIYLDLDVVVTTCLEDLKNFAGLQDSTVGAGAIGFSDSTLGRHAADICITDLKYWGHDGPGVITRMLEKLCCMTDIRNMTTERCEGFKLLPPSSFYPIHYNNWKLYFEKRYKNSTMESVKKARAIHVWNKLSMNEKVRVDSDVPYAIVARQYCPKIFANCREIF